ncbi:MAG TPA: cupredoxin domain-containing protein, partial [Actinomycetota bacterium]
PILQEGVPRVAKIEGCLLPRPLIKVTASQLAFNTDCIQVPANTPLRFRFDNRDPVVHIFTIVKLGDWELAFELGPQTVLRRESEPIEPGSYIFRCGIHPETMRGTLEAV